MKDEKLEKEFDEYFKGLNTPDNITADAKKYVKPKSAFLPKFLKFAGVAASFVLVFTVAFVAFFNFRDNADGDDIPDAAPPALSVYGDDVLTKTAADAYALAELNPSLKLIQNMAYAANSSVTSCSAYYSEEKLTLVKADVLLISQSVRSESEIFVEFTDDTKVYSPLKEHLDGTVKHYKGLTYYITEQTAENGEPLFKLYVTKGGVKYYFNVTSSDESAYLKYLEMLIK